MDREEEIKEAQNRAYVEWFERAQKFAQDDSIDYENPLPSYSREPEFQKNHSESLDSFPLVPVESKAKTFILDLVGTLLAVGLLMIFMFL